MSLFLQINCRQNRQVFIIGRTLFLKSNRSMTNILEIPETILFCDFVGQEHYRLECIQLFIGLYSEFKIDSDSHIGTQVATNGQYSNY